MQEHYQPDGIEFTTVLGREFLLNMENTGWRGWLFIKHPDGQWVSFREAEPDDLLTILDYFRKFAPPKIIFQK